jgi:hypothetical protein
MQIHNQNTSVYESECEFCEVANFNLYSQFLHYVTWLFDYLSIICVEYLEFLVLR